MEQVDPAHGHGADRVAVVGVLEADEARPPALAALRPPLEGHLQRDLDRASSRCRNRRRGVRPGRRDRRAAARRARSPADGRGRASSSERRGRAGRGRPRRSPGDGGRGRCTTATRPRRCRRCRRCRRGSCPRRGRSSRGPPVRPALLLGERVPDVAAVGGGQLGGRAHAGQASFRGGRNGGGLVAPAQSAYPRRERVTIQTQRSRCETGAGRCGGAAPVGAARR